MPKPQPKPSGDASAIDRCCDVLSKHMHMPDASPMMAALGCIAANYMTGPPVWLMLVSPPSSGKTQLINSCVTLPHVREAGQCKNSAAFLTYDKEFGLGGLLSQPRRDKDGFTTGGIGDFGVLLYTEFSNVLSLPQEQRDEVISIHRQIYDGRCSRQYGTAGGRVLEWEGKCGALGAITGVIDDNPLSADLGERWVYYRFPESDLRAQANAVLNMSGTDPADRNAAFRTAMHDVFKECGIKYGDARRELDEHEKIWLADIASASCRLRGSVRRDRFTREITSSPQIEGSGRMTNELTGLYLGTEKIGLRNRWSWKLVYKIGLDSAPALRMEILKAVDHLHYMREEASTTAVAGMMKVSRRTTDRYLEDLSKLGCVQKDDDGNWVIERHLLSIMKRLEKLS